MGEVETLRESGARQVFSFAKRGAYWESVEEIPEPHGFEVTVMIGDGGHAHSYHTAFAEHDHSHGGNDHGDHPDHEDELDPTMIRSTRRHAAALQSSRVIVTRTGTAAEPFTSIGTITTKRRPTG